MGGFPDVTVAPQIIVERMVHLCLVKTKQNMNPRRLDVRINYANTMSLDRQKRGNIGCSI